MLTFNLFLNDYITGLAAVQRVCALFQFTLLDHVVVNLVVSRAESSKLLRSHRERLFVMSFEQSQFKRLSKFENTKTRKKKMPDQTTPAEV